MRRMQVYDTHCHLGLDGKAVPADEHMRARAAQVTDMMVFGNLDFRVFLTRLKLIFPGDLGLLAFTDAGRVFLDGDNSDDVHWSAGLHPNDSSRFDAEWSALTALAETPGCTAIGETGLDNFRDRTPAPQQERALRAHLALARRVDLPVIFHCRDAFAPLFAVLRSEQQVRGVMHCFSGGVEQAREALDLGLYLSFAGPLTYPKNQALRDAAAFAPADRIVVETDAPFLPPQRRRGQRNEPAFVVETLDALAQARGITLADAAALTFSNATALFG